MRRAAFWRSWPTAPKRISPIPSRRSCNVSPPKSPPPCSPSFWRRDRLALSSEEFPTLLLNRSLTDPLSVISGKGPVTDAIVEKALERRPHGRDYRSSAQDAARGEKRRLAEALRQAIAEEPRSGGGGSTVARGAACPAVRKGRDAPAARGGCAGGAATPSAPGNARAARPLEAARGRVDGVRGLHGRRAAARDGGQGGGVAAHGVVHEDARSRGWGRRLLPARGGVLRDGRHLLPGVDAGQPLRGWFGLGRPAHWTATTPPAPHRRVGVRAVRRQRETGDCFCELGRRRRGRAGVVPCRAGGGCRRPARWPPTGGAPMPARSGQAPRGAPAASWRW